VDGSQLYPIENVALDSDALVTQGQLFYNLTDGAIGGEFNNIASVSKQNVKLNHNFARGFC
jgi:hypothetical protein